MPDPDRDILDLIHAGRKIEAIKLAREHLGMGLAEAKAFVDGLAADAAEPTPAGQAETVFDGEIDRLLGAKRKIDAIKLYRERTGCGLKDAKDAVEARAVELGLQGRPSKCFIATAACAGGEQAEVAALRRFRNRVLRRRWWGRALIAAYERVSPPLAALVTRCEPLAALARPLIRALARACEPAARRG